MPKPSRPARAATPTGTPHPGEAAPEPAGAWLASLGGTFLAFEGADGSGKSTQLRRFVGAVGAAGLKVCEVREPGGTTPGERIRAVLLDKEQEDMTLRCEMLLYMASRAQLVERCIRPALARGELVVADRFVSSTYAYQGAAGGLPEGEIDAVARVATQGCLPDLVIVFDVDTDTAARRTRGVEARGRKAPASAGLFDDRIEQRGREFHEKVRRSYLDQAARDPARHLVVDASGTEETVWARFLRDLERRLAPSRA